MIGAPHTVLSTQGEATLRTAKGWGGKQGGAFEAHWGGLVERTQGGGTVGQQNLAFLDIPSCDQSASKLRMSVNSDWEASSVTFPVLRPVLIT